MNSNGYNYNELIKLYNSVGLETRNMKFLAKWFCDMYDFSHLPSIDDTYKDQLVLDKLKLSIFNILIDDLADNYRIRNKKLFEKALCIPWNYQNNYKNKYLRVAKDIWLDFSNSIKSYPRYEEFKDVFYFDLDQFLDSIKYSMLINSVGLNNLLETRIYSPQNMQVILFLDMDLMCSPNFKKKELGKLRPILLWTQDLLHMGHVINTYPREIQELDFSSTMISFGLNEGVIKEEDVIRNPKKTLESLKYLIPYLKSRVEGDFQKIKDHANTIESIDISDFYKRVRRVYKCFLQRPQYWKTTELEEKEEFIKPIIPVIPNNAVKWVRM